MNNEDYNQIASDVNFRKTTSEVVNCYNCAWGRSSCMRSANPLCAKLLISIDDDTTCDKWKNCIS